MATLGSYGAWHSPAHAHLFGFDTYGRCHDWAWLVRRNHLLSLYNVRYLVAAGREFRSVIESVRIEPAVAAGREPADRSVGAATRPEHRRRGVALADAVPVAAVAGAGRRSSCRQGGIYRIALDARGAEDGGGNLLEAKVLRELPDGREEDTAMGTDGHRRADRRGLAALRVDAARAGVPGWPSACSAWIPQVNGPSRSATSRSGRAGWETPVTPFGALPEGEAVYRKVAELPPLHAGDEPVAIYENRLCLPAGMAAVRGPADEASIEHLRWMTGRGATGHATPRNVPDVSLGHVPAGPPLVLWTTVPAAGLLAVVGAVAWGWRRRGVPANRHRTD